MKITKPQIKKLIGYLSAILLLIFNGESFLDTSGDVISILNQV